mmetsp:Transcript_18892/g.47710  ORF Transcript_18892/g.47710 Transcript_18892/m.47710 type:complete len:206 (+) Transcript_18892:498-1115(+)
MLWQQSAVCKRCVIHNQDCWILSKLQSHGAAWRIKPDSCPELILPVFCLLAFQPRRHRCFQERACCDVPVVSAYIQALVIAIKHVHCAPIFLRHLVQLPEKHDNANFAVPAVHDIPKLNDHCVATNPHGSTCAISSQHSRQLQRLQCLGEISMEIADCNNSPLSFDPGDGNIMLVCCWFAGRFAAVLRRTVHRTRRRGANTRTFL